MSVEKNDALITENTRTYSLIISIACLLSIGMWLFIPYSPIILHVISEIMPDRAIIDDNGSMKLEGIIYFIRQSFVTGANVQFQSPIYLYVSFACLAIVLCLLGLKKWAQIPTRYFISGLALWLILVLWMNQNQVAYEIRLVIFEQIHTLGIGSLMLMGIFISAAIPRTLFQIGHGSSPKQSKTNWLYFFGFYLMNLIITYGKEYLGWEISYAIPGFLLCHVGWIALAFQLGRLNTFLAWGINLLGLSTLVFFVATGNDSGISAFIHWTLICQIVMLFLFPLFILSNFQIPLKDNLPVYKIVHKAPTVDLRLMYIGVAILSIAWVYGKNASVIHQFQAAFYNTRGDLALINEGKKSAEFSYQQAMLHSKLNAKSSLSLAALALQANDSESAAYYLATSLQKHASVAAFVSLANIYQQNDHTFEALFTLQKANRQFPNSFEIMTELAKQFESIKTLDSATYYYQKAFEAKPNNPISQGNLLYITKKNSLKTNSDPSVRANQLAIALKSKSNIEIEAPDLELMPGNDLRQWAYLYNYAIYAKSNAPAYPMFSWTKNPIVLAAFPEQQVLQIWQNYYLGKPLDALQQIDLLIQNDTTSKTIGLQNMLAFWKNSLLKPQAKLQIKTLNEARTALQKQPFQVDVLQQSLSILNQNKQEKLGYDAALSALQWNENIPVYYLIFAIQAYQLGELTYANEAVNTLKSLSPATFTSNRQTLDRAKESAQKRQNFD